MRVVFMGTPDFSVPTLQALIDSKYDVVGVFTQPDRPKGRGGKVQMSPVKELALKYDIPVFQPLKIRKDGVDGFILSHVDGSVAQWDKVDRSIVKVTNTDNLVLIYNKYSEEQRLRSKEICLKEDGYEMKPVATIPEVPVELYSRCIACRVNEAGGVESLQPEDYDKFMKCLAE